MLWWPVGSVGEDSLLPTGPCNGASARLCALVQTAAGAWGYNEEEGAMGGAACWLQTQTGAEGAPPPHEGV